MIERRVNSIVTFLRCIHLAKLRNYGKCIVHQFHNILFYIFKFIIKYNPSECLQVRTIRSQIWVRGYCSFKVTLWKIFYLLKESLVLNCFSFQRCIHVCLYGGNIWQYVNIFNFAEKLRYAQTDYSFHNQPCCCGLVGANILSTIYISC